MSAHASGHFRFLDLPKDVRQCVYDFFPIATRHHVILPLKVDIFSKNPLTIVSFRIPGISLLAACRAIKEEAVSLGRSIEAINGAPLRLSGHWQSLNGSEVKAILLCASNSDCSNNREVKILLATLELWGFEDIKHATSPAIRRDFDPHHELHNVLRRGATSTCVPRHVEILILWEGDMLMDYHFEQWMWDFYPWVKHAGKDRKTGETEDMRIILRPSARGAPEMNGFLRSNNKVFTAQHFTEERWASRTWPLVRGGDVTVAELEEWWIEGETRK